MFPLAHIVLMDMDESPPHSFRCPNLNCRAEYVVISKAQPPVERPCCIDCETPFLAMHQGQFLHYQSLRFD
jgi:hypothetical protein